MATLKAGEWNRLTADQTGERLDVAVSRLAPELSRSRVQKLVDEGYVKVAGEPAKSNRKLEGGDAIEVFLPAPKSLDLKAESIPIHVYYQDEHLAVVEKPAGLVVHPAVGHSDGTLVNALLHHFPDLAKGTGIGGTIRPGIVHRIDKNTSGILLVTKNDAAHLDLSRQFKEHSITRRYLGLAWGELPEKGEWKEPIARDPKERKRMAIVPGGRNAITRFRRLDSFPGLSLFEAELFTGRTHQIRVHFSSHGFPLAGDSVYGNSVRSAGRTREMGKNALVKRCPESARLLASLQENGRQFLHAAHLGFVHPVSGAKLSFESDLPADLQKIVLSLNACKAK